MSVTGGILAGTALAGSVATGITGSMAAGAQATQDQNAANISAKAGADSLTAQNNEWAAQQKLNQPYLDAGKQAVNNLSSLTATPGQGLLAGYGQTFSAPTLAEAEATPGYQFQLQTGTDAIARQASATGNLMSGNTGVALQKYGQGLADSTYNDRYNQALQTFGTNENTFYTNQNNEFNRLNSISNMGANQTNVAGQEGQAMANNTANIDLTSAGQQGQDLTNKGTAQASGYAAIGNSINSGLSSVNNLANLNALNNIVNPSSGAELSSATF